MTATHTAPEIACESWRIVWRNGFVPVLSSEALGALAAGLRADDPRIAQGCTTRPPPLMCVADWPIECGCVLAFAGWQANGLTTVGEANEFFARTCFDADQKLGEPAACRWFLNWADDTPRPEMVRELLAEVELTLRSRLAVAG